MNTKQLTQFALKKLDDMKAQDIRVLDVSAKSSVTEVMIVATGISTVHVKAIAANVSVEAKRQNHQHLVWKVSKMVNGFSLILLMLLSMSCYNKHVIFIILKSYG